MSWSFLEKLLTDLSKHVSLAGKIWITYLLVFRLNSRDLLPLPDNVGSFRVVVVLSIGDKIFSDDQSKFSCDTQIPGSGFKIQFSIQCIHSVESAD